MFPRNSNLTQLTSGDSHKGGVVTKEKCTMAYPSSKNSKVLDSQDNHNIVGLTS